MARKVRRTLLAGVLSLIVGVAALIPGAAAGRSGEGACLDARHMALVSNAMHRGVAVDARLVECGR
jgi:hypothetical protein